MTVQPLLSGTSNAWSGFSRTEIDTYQFLRLLIIELTSQNPMDPVKDRDFLAQMAQLNTAQQMERMGQVITAFQSASLIGREVEAVLPNGTRIHGKVEAIEISGGQVLLTILDQRVPFSAISTIR